VPEYEKFRATESGWIGTFPKKLGANSVSFACPISPAFWMVQQAERYKKAVSKLFSSMII